jgi:hypothetical protein
MYRDVESLYQGYLEAQASAPGQITGLEEEIRKSIGGNVAIADYQTMQGASGAAGAEFSPLIPEALDPVVGQVDFKAQHLEFFDWLPKQDVKNTLVTFMKTVENGNRWIPRALMEGAISINNQSRNSRSSTRIKSYVETRELSDIQNAIPLAGGISGVPSAALAYQTTKGMLSLHRILEADALFGSGYDGNVNALDGIQPQLIRAGQSENFDGAQVTMEYLEDRVRTMQSAPYYGDPTHIKVTPKVFTSLSKQQLAMGRRPMDGSGVKYGFNEKGGLVIKAGNREIPVEPMTFQDNQADAPPEFHTSLQNAAIDALAPPAPTLDAPASSVAGTGFFGAGDAGDYWYSVVACTEAGAYTVIDAKFKCTAVAGQVNFFEIAHNATNPPAYYLIFRTAKGASGLDVKQYHYIGTVAKVAGLKTPFTDAHTVRSQTGSVMILRQDPEEIVLYQLIKLFRKPLAQNRMTNPFALFTACGLQVKVPEHQWLITNVGY